MPVESGLRGRLVVGLVQLEHLFIRVQKGGEHVVAVLNHPFIGGWADRCHVDGRMRLLHRLGDDVDLADLVELALVLKWSGPGLQDDLQRLFEALAAFFRVNPPVVKLLELIPPAYTKEQPAFRHDIDGGKILGDDHRVVERQHHHGCADLDPLGNGRCVGRHCVDGGGDGVVIGIRNAVIKMVLGKPKGIPAGFVQEPKLREGLVVGFDMVFPRRSLE